MGAINAYSGPEFPGAVNTIDVDLGAPDCALFDTFEALVSELQETPERATTIRFGRAYTEATTGEISTICTV